MVLPGDGIGPEVTREARRVLEAVAPQHGIALDFEEHLIGGASIDAHGTPLRDEVIERAPQEPGRAARRRRRTEVGRDAGDHAPRARPAAHPQGARPLREPAARQRCSRRSRRPRRCGPRWSTGIDMLVVRELTGGLYFGEPRGTAVVNGLREARNTMVYDESEIARITRVAFQAARRRRKHVTHVHKANVLETSQLWVQVVEEIAPEFPDVTLAHQLVDSCAMLLVRDPGRFDVIVTENLFGDILSDEAAQITGSLGMLPSASLGAGGIGLYEPVHGSAPDIAGKDVANPLAAILSAAMLFEHSFGAIAAAQQIRDAVTAVLDAGHRTADLLLPGEQRAAIGCRAMGDLVVARLGA